VTFVADSTSEAISISNANPALWTAGVAHGWTTGDTIEISEVGGMTELNGQTVTVTDTGANTATIGIDSTSYGAHTAGGKAKKFAQDGEVYTWAGEFDVPVRFGADQMQVSIVDKNVLTWAQIPLVELREGT